jgi:tripartite ATP-independent transporter DctM subunit
MGIEVLFVALMFAAFMALLFTGYPVAFVLGGVGVLFALLGDALPLMGIDSLPVGSNFLGFATDRIFSTVSNYSLVPMAMFVFMGYMLDRSGIADRLLDALSLAMRRVPGGMALAVVLIGVILAASTGIIGASVILLATVALPALSRSKTNLPLSLGLVASSGCLGILIPPSIMLIVMGDQLRLSVGDLFMAAVLPGLMLAGLYVLFVVILAIVRPDLAPRPPAPEDGASTAEVLGKVVRALILPLLLMVSVLGSIFAGIASPTEASGIGALGATLLAAIDRKLSWKTIKDVCFATANTSAFLYGLIFGATCFSVVLRGYGGDEVIEAAFTSLPLPPEGVLGLLLFIVFLLGFFLDWMEIVLIIAPLTVPVVTAMGFDPLWVAILLAMVLQTSFLTPPVGMALFYVKWTAPPGTRTSQVYKGVIPFVGLQLLAVGLLWMFPELALWLPSTSGQGPSW